MPAPILMVDAFSMQFLPNFHLRKSKMLFVNKMADVLLFDSEYNASKGNNFKSVISLC